MNHEPERRDRGVDDAADPSHRAHECMWRFYRACSWPFRAWRETLTSKVAIREASSGQVQKVYFNANSTWRLSVEVLVIAAAPGKSTGI